nr:hypothetical protein Iba_chr03dCG0950 [Ipomoea batatas]
MGEEMVDDGEREGRSMAKLTEVKRKSEEFKNETFQEFKNETTGNNYDKNNNKRALVQKETSEVSSHESMKLE